ncbi:MAG: lysine-sensitive aspartokinase 3 [Acidobacteriota bacterium]|nr:lysine-sensitive aspartokinase 3 [Acidobacteriota bacterium]
MIIAKFGGTSMEDASAMVRCAASIAARPQQRIIVVSATAGTTELLLGLVRDAGASRVRQVELGLAALRERHLEIADALDVDDEERRSLVSLIERVGGLCRGIGLLGEATPRVIDNLVGQGERMASLLFTRVLKNAGLNATMLDADRIIRTDEQFGRAEPQIAQIRLLVREHLIPLAERGHVVTQGFVGATAEGVPTTLGRGGSDYSAALLAEAVGAEHVNIWTDVSGIATTDPGLIAGTRTIPELSFAEAAELAVYGARVLHPATLWPAIRENIPVFVGSSRDPEAGGTWIRPDVAEGASGFRAMAVRRNQKLITITSLRMLHTPGFLARIFNLLAKHNISVDMLTTSEISVSLTIDEPVRFTPEIADELSRFAEVRIEEDLALIALVGNGINRTAGLASRILGLLEGINVRLICQGASDYSIGLLVEGRAIREALSRIHTEISAEAEVTV